MPVPAMAEPVLDHQRRFEAAVDVIHNLPKNGSYRPSYEVMLRFYGLYKQAVCGPCSVPRPGFWDPVGRYKWDAWSCLGQMSSENAMAAYVEEMKKVAQEVIDTMPMNEKTASLFHHFEPLYLVIDDIPRPPDSLLALRDGLNNREKTESPALRTDEHEEHTDTPQELNEQENVQLTANTVPHDCRLAEGLVVTSDSESDIFCDSVDSVEQLKVQLVKPNGFHNSPVSQEGSAGLCGRGLVEGRQVGAGRGGEGAEEGKGLGSSRRGRDGGRDGSHHSWRQRGDPQGNARRGPPGAAGGAGRGGGDGSEGGAELLHDAHLQQQIILALRRLREDMRSVMDRLEGVERLAATHAQGAEWSLCRRCADLQEQEEKWWPWDVSAQTIIVLLLWPFVAQGLVHLLRRAHRRSSNAP
ncbi:acyl-CoA-binding domain-containing protein 4 isoform X2 [Gouania willdenowi]|uniref:ACB domain-containing protein n=1 Tax=Gouania willdenowi TaxID=441366 RepID=A0A8C5NB37_GOUWI|nr:acyl-CoA-binding domain-containing protein 4 isoform X2 [Gouania willdenowi]